jgi:hypothetical protein
LAVGEVAAFVQPEHAIVDGPLGRRELAAVARKPIDAVVQTLGHPEEVRVPGQY